MHVVCFTDQWFDNLIASRITGYRDRDTSDDAVAQADAILTAGAMIAQAIEHLAEKVAGTGNAQEAIETLTEVLAQK
jgi:hypothetical protein